MSYYDSHYGKEGLDKWQNTMFWQRDEECNPHGCCIRVRDCNGTYMLCSNTWELTSAVEEFLKNERPNDVLPSCIDDADEAFMLLQKFAKENNLMSTI